MYVVKNDIKKPHKNWAPYLVFSTYLIEVTLKLFGIKGMNKDDVLYEPFIHRGRCESRWIWSRNYVWDEKNTNYHWWIIGDYVLFRLHCRHLDDNRTYDS